MDRIKLLKLYKESLRTGIIDDEILLYLINDEIEKKWISRLRKRNFF